MDRPKCVVCGKEQTDMASLGPVARLFLEEVEVGSKFEKRVKEKVFHILFPICDNHSLADLKPDQYVFDQIIVEVS